MLLLPLFALGAVEVAVHAPECVPGASEEELAGSPVPAIHGGVLSMSVCACARDGYVCCVRQGLSVRVPRGWMRK